MWADLKSLYRVSTKKESPPIGICSAATSEERSRPPVQHAGRNPHEQGAAPQDRDRTERRQGSEEDMDLMVIPRGSAGHSVASPTLTVRARGFRRFKPFGFPGISPSF